MTKMWWEETKISKTYKQRASSQSTKTDVCAILCVFVRYVHVNCDVWYSPLTHLSSTKKPISNVFESTTLMNARRTNRNHSQKLAIWLLQCINCEHWALTQCAKKTNYVLCKIQSIREINHQKIKKIGCLLCFDLAANSQFECRRVRAHRMMSASMNSPKNAVASDLYAVSGHVNGNASNKNNNTIPNSTANDMSSTTAASPINASTVNGVAEHSVNERSDDESKKFAAKINCRPNDDNNSSPVVVAANGSRGGGGGGGGGINISKSWYARCNNRWRSQSCDRKHKNMVIRYSWNTAAINRLA